MKAGINHFLDTYKPDLTKALKDGLLTEADMDAALKNLLTVYLKLGEMDPPGVDPYAKIGVETGGRGSTVGACIEQGAGAAGDGRIDCAAEE